MSFNAFALQHTMDPKPVQSRLLNHHDPGELARAGVSLALQLRKAAQQLSQIAAWHLMPRHLLASARQQGRHEPDGATEFQRNNDCGLVRGRAPGSGRGVGRLHGLSPPGRKSWRPYSRRELGAAHLLMASLRDLTSGSSNHGRAGYA